MNIIEIAALNYTVNETIIDNDAMTEIMANSKDLKKGLADISAGMYNIIG